MVAEHEHVRDEADTTRVRGQKPEGGERIVVARPAGGDHSRRNGHVLAAGEVRVAEPVGRGGDAHQLVGSSVLRPGGVVLRMRVSTGVTSASRIACVYHCSPEPGNGATARPPWTSLRRPADEAFRARARSWLAANRPVRAERVPHDDRSLAEEFALLLDWQRRLHAAGFVGLLWPRDYGGHGAPPGQQAILNEELARAGAPQLINRVGINNAGPTIIAHGTEAQKRRWLPADPLGRRDLVPAVQRAQCGQRPWPRYAPAPSPRRAAFA